VNFSQKGVKVLSTGRDAHQESMMKTVSNQLNLIQVDVSHNKEQERRAHCYQYWECRLCKLFSSKNAVCCLYWVLLSTLKCCLKCSNLMSVLTILLTVEEVYPMLPVSPVNLPSPYPLLLTDHRSVVLCNFSHKISQTKVAGMWATHRLVIQTLFDCYQMGTELNCILTKKSCFFYELENIRIHYFLSFSFLHCRSS
jgi:hypothetical protein